MTEKDYRSYDGINFIELYPNSYIYTEMYATEEIKSYFHPLIASKSLLKKNLSSGNKKIFRHFKR